MTQKNPFPSPCLKCDAVADPDKCTSYRTCNAYKTWVCWWWKRFNALARKHGIDPTTPVPDDFVTAKGGHVTLYEARRLAGLRQVDLAAKLGVPYSAISQWERNLIPVPRRYIDQLCAALHVEPQELIISEVAP